MEAATPLRKPHVRTVGERLAIDGLVVDDETAVRLVRERENSGDDGVSVVTDAIEIGARVLDREQAGANADFVRAEFEKASHALQQEFTEKARMAAEDLETKIDEVLGPENGQLSKELEKLFSDGSKSSVQNRVRELLDQAMVRYREDLIRQFSSADGSNPLADFKAGTIRVLKQAEERQHRDQHAVIERMGELEKQLQALRLEKEKLEELEEERERGSAKGRTFEELVADAVDELAVALGDDAEAVGDLKGPTGKTGDVVVAIDAACGPARGRVVFEAKDQRLSKPKAFAELDRAMRERDADFAVLVVPSDEEVPAKTHPLREYNGDKLIVTLDPDEGSRLALELGYRLARARVLMSRASDEEVDAAAIRDSVERALQEMEDVRKVKSQLTGAKTNIDNAYGIVEAIAERVRAHLAEIEALSRAGEPEADAQQSLVD